MKTELQLTVATAALAMANICPVSVTALISTAWQKGLPVNLLRSFRCFR